MSAIEDLLESQLAGYCLPDFIREYKAIEGRKFKWDFAFLSQRLLVEVQGGVFMRRGGHTSGVGVTRDCEKHNLAMLAGWKDLLVTSQMVKDGRALAWIMEACGIMQGQPKGSLNSQEEDMKKEIGIPKGASKMVKRMDERADKKAGIKEGSKADLKKDREIMKRFARKGAK